MEFHWDILLNTSSLHNYPSALLCRPLLPFITPTLELVAHCLIVLMAKLQLTVFLSCWNNNNPMFPCWKRWTEPLITHLVMSASRRPPPPLLLHNPYKSGGPSLWGPQEPLGDHCVPLCWLRRHECQRSPLLFPSNRLHECKSPKLKPLRRRGFPLCRSSMGGLWAWRRAQPLWGD